MTKPRHLAPTLGPAQGGVEFSTRALPGFGRYAVGLMTKSHHRKYHIDNSSWGPEAGSIESGHRVPFGKIHIFIGKIGTPVPEPDICTDIVEPARLAQPATSPIGRRRIFVNFTQEASLPDEPEACGDTPINFDGESSIEDTDSIYPLYERRLGGFPEAAISEGPQEPPRLVAIYIARDTMAQDQPNVATANGASGSGKTLAQAMSDLMVEMSKLMAVAVMADNQEEVNVELAKFCEDMAQVQRQIDAEKTWMGNQQVQIDEEVEHLQLEAWRLAIPQTIAPEVDTLTEAVLALVLPLKRKG